MDLIAKTIEDERKNNKKNLIRIFVGMGFSWFDVIFGGVVIIELLPIQKLVS